MREPTRRAAPAERTVWAGRARLILLALDGSPEAHAALPAARLAARLADASLHVVHALDQPVSEAEALTRLGLSASETPGLVIDQVVGPPAEAIIRWAAESRAMLIVLTTRGRTPYQGRVLRPVAEAIVRHAPCPVLLVRPEIAERVRATTDLRRIVLPLDGAPSSAAVIAPALELAARAGAEVDILFVAGPAAPPAEPGTLTGPVYVDQPQHEWPAWAREFIARFGTSLGRYPPATHCRLFLRTGDPASEILRFASEHASDLIVLEWRGRLDPTHARVVKAVLANAPCPVLLLRTR